MADNVPDLIRDTLDKLSLARNNMIAAVREVTWAYQDLQSKLQMPVEENGPERDKDAFYSEVATRSVLPGHLPAIKTIVDLVSEQLDKLIELVPPIKLEDTKNGN